MQVSLSDTGGLSRRLEVAVPATEVAREVQQRLKRLSRTARLKGFRPGKALGGARGAAAPETSVAHRTPQGFSPRQGPAHGHRQAIRRPGARRGSERPGAQLLRAGGER